MNRNCGTCAAFSPFYRAVSCRFLKEYEGVCGKCGDFVNRDGVCEYWVGQPRPQELSPELFNKAVDDVKYILNYFVFDK